MLKSETTNQTSHASELDKKIQLITEYQSPYIKKRLENMTKISLHNVDIIVNYIIAEQNEINIKESTKEGKIKCLVSLSQFLNHKPFGEVAKQDILEFLNSLKKPLSEDPKHKSIGTYNGRQMIISKFFRWLYNPDEPDFRNTAPSDQLVRPHPVKTLV